MSIGRGLLIGTLAVALTGGFAHGAQIGEPAPPLKIVDWIKGQPVDFQAGKGKIYLVEFWATWCGPCKLSIPHLTELQADYKAKGVVVIGISDEDAATVRTFLDTHTDKVTGKRVEMGYTVACDSERATTEAYFKPFELEGIPQVFIVDKQGNLAWHGSPFESAMEETIDHILDGSYNAAATKKAIDARDAPMREAMRAMRKSREALKTYFDLAAKDGAAREADGVGEQILKEFASSPMVLNQFAWFILTKDGIQTRNRDLALRAAKAALDGTGGTDAAILDTYARALFDTGKVDEAIKYQTKAVELCTDPHMKPELEDALNKYLAAR